MRWRMEEVRDEEEKKEKEEEKSGGKWTRMRYKAYGSGM